MPTASETFQARDFLYVAPEILLAAWGLIVLVVDVSALRKSAVETRRTWLGLLSLVGALGALALAFLDAPTLAGVAYDDPDPSLFFGTIAGDAATTRLNLVVAALLALVVGMSMAWSFTEHWGEYFALLFWSAAGMMGLIASEELLVLFLNLELMTICLYLAASFEGSKRRSAEAGLKYFVYGSVASALFLFGLSWIYGLTGSTRIDAIRLALGEPRGLSGNLAGSAALLLVLVGFGFKVAAVPFHMWAPDAYEGAPAPVSAFIATGSKLASVAALLKVLVHGLGTWGHPTDDLTGPGWIGVVALIAAATMTFGNLAALGQTNFKRLLGYSSIAQGGYILVGVVAASAAGDRGVKAAGAVLFYLVIYAFTTLGAFAVAAWLAREVDSDELADLDGLGRRSPGMSACVAVLMLSLIGVPPFAGFFGKLSMFLGALDTKESGRLSLIVLVGLALANTALSAFYYFRVIRALYLRPPAPRAIGPAPRSVSWPIVIGALVAIGFGVAPGLLLESMEGAAVSLLSAGGRPIEGRQKTSFQAGPRPIPEASRPDAPRIPIGPPRIPGR